MTTEERSSAEALDRLRELAMSSGESMRTVATWVLDERPTSAPLLEQEKTIRRDDP